MDGRANEMGLSIEEGIHVADVTIKVRTDGPYQVFGDVELLDAAGLAIPLAEDGKLFLCRCGHSSNKPFCDGTHKSSGWCDTLVIEDPEAG
jgi:CDGSH-type Zn-finger protein